jgi:Condensation domain
MSEGRSPEALAAARQALLEKRRKGKAADVASVTQPPIPARAADAPAVASFGQERLWYIQQMQPQSTAYHMTNATRLCGALNVAALTDAIHQVMARHEALRTTFVLEDGALVQRIALPKPLTLLHEQTTVADLEARIRAFANLPFDLAQGMLVRVGLLRVADDDAVLVIVMHHIISDEWSLDIFWRDLVQAYVGNALEPLPLHYADYALWQRDQLKQGAFADDERYWREQLAGDLPLLNVPTDHPRPRLQTYHGGWAARTLPHALSEQLTALSREAGATLFVTLLAAYQVLLQRYTQQTDILVGVPVTNRERVELQSMIGFFLNTVVVRADFRPARKRSRIRTFHLSEWWKCLNPSVTPAITRSFKRCLSIRMKARQTKGCRT